MSNELNQITDSPENTMSHLDQASALATVDKTPEQREAERQQKLRTEELAGWIVRANAARKRFLLLSKLADGLSTESIERIATAMPYILAEAVNELDGKVELLPAVSTFGNYIHESLTLSEQGD